MNDAYRSFETEMLACLGHAPHAITPGKLIRFGRKKSCWCWLSPDSRRGSYGCHRRAIDEKWSALDKSSLTEQELAARQRNAAIAATEYKAAELRRRAKNASRINRLWSECRPPLRDDPSALYLASRGIDRWPLPCCLRFHEKLPYWCDGRIVGKYPAMVAPLVSPQGQIMALHRTYLTSEGRKANVSEPRKLTGTAGNLAGSFVPLHRPFEGRIGIAEGIETALAATCASGIPTVASYCASNLSKLEWPAGVRQLIVFADADPCGREAAENLRQRAIRNGLRCSVLTPSVEGLDWCDIWATQASIGEEAGA